MSTHQMYQVEALCNRIVLIDDGQTVLYGLVNEIKRNFAGNAVILAGQGTLPNCPACWRPGSKTACGTCRWKSAPTRRRYCKR